MSNKDKNSNVIMIIADQMRWDALPCNGADFVKAPNFKRLASEGINFTSCYSGNPVCVPARGILATGCYSHNCMDKSFLNQNGGTIVKNDINIARQLKNKGYMTYGFGKFHYYPYKVNPGYDVFEVAEEGRIDQHVSKGELPEDIIDDYQQYLKDVGYDGWARIHMMGNNVPWGGKSPLPLEHYVDVWSTTRAIDTMKDHLNEKPDKPFYLQLGWVKPHPPYDPPAPYDGMYDPREIPEPVGDCSDLDGRNPWMEVERRNWCVSLMGKSNIQYSRAQYFALVSLLDSQLGRILDFLEKNNLKDNTAIVFTADHGDYIGDHGMFFKRYFHEGSTRIPLIICSPKIKQPAGRYEQPVGQEDIVPTIYDLIDTEHPEGMDGKSLILLIENPSLEHKELIISQYDMADGMSIMSRQGDFKYCFARFNSTEELYDLKADPHELKNLAKDARYADKLIEMRNKTNQWCIEYSHDPILNEDGQLTYTEFREEDYWTETSRKLGIYRW
jgi:arylsulfatase